MFTAIRRAVALLDRRERWRWAALAPIAAAVAAVETAGAGAVFLLVRVLADPAYRPPRPLQFMAGVSRPGAAASVAGLIIAFYIARGLVLVGAEYVQERVVQRTSARIAVGLLSRYVHAPYPFHFRRSTASLVQQVNDGAEQVVERVLASALHIAEEALVVAALLTVVAVAAPVATVGAV